ncbi:pyridoxamine 5'-phosphate oxidase family protein [Streptomyces sp. NPDC023838]|uniref:pyridoxamine 5'-phosphate oxidase family protein n=1 Tax=Streptomyces sp. NPDC023838 TaxID=3154325 RepID=UPI0033C8CAA2
MSGTVYHEGSRFLQRRLGTERLADHIAERYVLDALADEHIGWITGADVVYLATVSPEGQPECSYKGGLPGFVRVLDPHLLEIPSYDGNGMYRSLGNAVSSPKVGLLFLFPEHSAKLRLTGYGEVTCEPEDLAAHHGAQAVLRVRIREVFENCPRYLHDVAAGVHSPHCPRPGHQPPDPSWKLKPEYDGLVTRSSATRDPLTGPTGG